VLLDTLLVICIIIYSHKFRVKAGTEQLQKSLCWLHHEIFTHQRNIMFMVKSILPNLGLCDTTFSQYSNDLVEELAIFQQVEHRVEVELLLI